MADTNFYFFRGLAIAYRSHDLPNSTDKIVRAYLFIVATALVLSGLTYILAEITIMPWTRLYLFNLFFLAMLTAVSDAINRRALDQEGQSVIIPYIISIILKLVFSVIFIVVFVKKNSDLAKEIVFSFLAYYAVFSVIEIVIVNRRLRHKKF